MTSDWEYGPEKHNTIDSTVSSPTDFGNEGYQSVHDVTDRERANHLQGFCNGLRDEGWSDIHLMPLNENERGPVITDRCRLDSKEALSYLDTPEEAARQIRENSVRGYYLYANKESHNTGNLIITDEDEPEEWPKIRETLTVVSGSGSGIHRYWINDGWQRGSEGKGELDGIGSVRVVNTGVVVPGSIHHESGGIYHVVNNCSPAPLSPSDLPEGLQPSGNTNGDHTYQDLDEPDEEAVQTVQKAIASFRTNTETSRRAIEYFKDLRAGNNLREHGFISSENEKGCRHEANIALSGLLHGMLLMDGERDRDRNKRLIHHYLSWVAHWDEYKWTDRGQRRKLLVSDKYIRDTVNTAINSFEHDYFNKWVRKTKKHNFTGEYSELTKKAIMESIETHLDTDDYPTKSEVVEVCKYFDENPRSERTYGECLRKMVGKNLKMAHMGGNDFRYYSFGVDDPEGAESIKGGSWI